MSKVINFIIKYFWLILAVLLVLIFREFFVSLINKVLVAPFLSKVQSNLFNDILFVILSILLVIVIVYIHDYTLAILGLIAYLLIRISGYWDFTTFSKLDLAYTDLLSLSVLTILIIILVRVIINFLWSKFFNNKKINKPIKNEHFNIGFTVDSPITTYEQDDQKRSVLVSSLLKFIKHTDLSNSAFTIGISGDWGVGKTSFLNLLKEQINNPIKDVEKEENQQKDKSNTSDNNKPKNIIINFSPWLYLEDRKQSLERIFLDILHKSISKEIPKYRLKRQLKKYIHLVAGSYSHPLIKIFDSIISNESLEDLKHEINKGIREANIRIYVFIDDLDRLDTNEIVLIMKLIRNTADFANTVYFVAYDRNYVNQALKKINKYNYDLYLDKIFQFELNLTVDYELILGQLKQRLEEGSRKIKNKILAKEQLNKNMIEKFKERIEEEIKFIDDFINSIDNIRMWEDVSENLKNHNTFHNSNLEQDNYIDLSKNLRSYIYFTPRLLNKFINSFLFYASQLIENYEFKDLFYILLIKHKYPSVYDDLFLHPKIYFKPKNDLYYELDKDRAKKRLTLLGLPDFKINDVLELLERLCNDAERSGELSLCFKQMFYSYNVGYFTILSETEFFGALNLSEKEFLKKIDYWIEEATKQSHQTDSNKLSEMKLILLSKLKRINSKDKDTLIKILKAVFLIYNKVRFKFLPFLNDIIYSHYDQLKADFLSVIRQINEPDLIIIALEEIFREKVQNSKYNWAELMILLDIKDDKLNFDDFRIDLSIQEKLKEHFSQKEDLLFKMIETYLKTTQFNGDGLLVDYITLLLSERSGKDYIEVLKYYLNDDCHKIENFFKSQGYSAGTYLIKHSFKTLLEEYKKKCPKLKQIKINFK